MQQSKLFCRVGDNMILIHRNEPVTIYYEPQDATNEQKQKLHKQAEEGKIGQQVRSLFLTLECHSLSPNPHSFQPYQQLATDTSGVCNNIFPTTV
jgi:hypothetical protein